MWKEKIMSENNQSKRLRCRYCFPSETEQSIIPQFSFRNSKGLYMDVKAGGGKLSQQMTLPEYRMRILRIHGMLACLRN